MASLVYSDGKRFEIAADRPTKIGRGSDNDLVIPDKSVSRHHAIITVTEGRCFVRDLESANGTFLAGRQISAAPCADGDRIRFGDIEFTLANPEAGIAAAKTPLWWQSRRIQASVAAVALGAVILLGVLHHQGGNEQPQSSTSAESLFAGRNNFDLPEASRSFVGNWHGFIPLASSNPADFAHPSDEFGVTFYLDHDHVVMSVAFYANAEVKVTKLKAGGVDANHVTLEEDEVEKDTLGQPLLRRSRFDFGVASSNQLDCTDTQDFYRDPNAAPVAEVVYKGALGRVSEQEREKQVQEMERKGWKKQAEARAPVIKQ